MARTKNRSEVKKSKGTGNLEWKLGQYVRLSKEEIGKGRDDSNSVANQKKLLDEYYQTNRHEFVSVETYVDDGATGTDMSRENFQRLLADVMGKKINCVIVKDLSRLSRNYSDAGSLIENLFVQMNVRFISLHERIDSYQNPDSVSGLIVPITNVMNDNFCYQTSKKIREIFDYKRRNGEHIGSFAAYGYIKDPEDKNAIIIDEDAAQVVRDIFTMFLDGMSKNAIVRDLNEHGIPCPSLYKRSKGMKYQNPCAASAKIPLWSAQTINGILKNQVYVGDMVQGRYRIKSYKIHTQEIVPEDEWFIVENTHEPIISREVFGRTQELLKRDTRTAPGQRKLYLFSGFLRCADCGKAMTRSKVHNTVYYFCRTYKDQSKLACTKHSIRHDRLEAAVLYAIQQQVLVAISCHEMLQQIDTKPQRKSRSVKLDEMITAKEKELARVTRYKQSIYQDWKDGEISHKDYRHMRNDYELQAEEIASVIDRLHTEQRELENDVDAENPFIKTFKKHENIDKLSRDVLIELIDHILIYENGNISVKMKFSNEFLRISEYIAETTHQAVG